MKNEVSNAMHKYIFSTLAALTIALILLAGYAAYLKSQPATPTNGNAAISQTHFTQPFTLTGMNNEALTEKSFLGKPSLYFFGFTHCPDVCPTTLGALTGWLNALGPDAQKLNITFISIDPERDTPATLKAYLASFHPQIHGATGTSGQLATMAKQFMVYYAKVPVKAGENPKNYMMSHSSMILLADKDGTFMGTLDAHDPDTEALTKLRNLLK